MENDLNLLIPKTQSEYETAYSEMSRLIDRVKDENSPDARRLETLSVHLREYEKRHSPILPPSPIEAIQFRMEQLGLKQRDLEPFIGGKSTVSEVLNYKRPLTLGMVRNLHQELGIPAEILLGQPDQEPEKSKLDFSRFPVSEMVKRGWLDKSIKRNSPNLEDAMVGFLGALGLDFAPIVLYKKTNTARAKQEIDEYSLLAWLGRVVQVADTIEAPTRYVEGCVTKADLQQLAKVSVEKDGPLRAQQYLLERGIILVIEPHLKKTKLDGALIYRIGSPPVIGMTIRYDRIDNFWFCLYHELAHLILHSGRDSESFIDNLDVRYTEDIQENEADDFASDALVPMNAWRKSVASEVPSASAAKLLAKKLGIHVAIVAGRIRYETNNYKLLHNLLGKKEVGLLFAEMK